MIASLLVVSVVLLYWFLGRRDTYITISYRKISWDRKTVRDILGVGLPASIESILMSILAIFINCLLAAPAGTDAGAVNTAGWRVVFFAIIPMVAIGTSVISIAGAAYGTRKFDRIQSAHTFSIVLGISFALATGTITYIFAPQIAAIFSYSSECAHLSLEIAAFLATMCLFYPFMPPKIMSGSIFQATGRGMTSLVITVLRNLLLSRSLRTCSESYSATERSESGGESLPATFSEALWRSSGRGSTSRD